MDGCDGSNTLSRRRALIALGGSAAMLLQPALALAQPTGEGNGSMYFVPGGRIGFEKPDDIDVWSNRWILLSQDHTLAVHVREDLWLGVDHGSYLWDKHERSQRVATSLALEGAEARRFRSLAYDPSPNYAAESVVVRDSDWVGEVEVTTGDHGCRTCGTAPAPELAHRC